MMSPRTKRQELRRAAARTNKPYSSSSAIDDQKQHLANESPDCSRRRVPLLSEILPPPPTSDLDTPRDLGMPTRAQYVVLEADYISALHPRKQTKALINQELFDKIWDVLHDPQSQKTGTPQFRWWVRKMFTLSYPGTSFSPAELETMGLARSLPVVVHEDRPVALREQLYDILCYCHDLAGHGGRDKTTAVIRTHYAWIPKELIAQFVKMCPTCIFKKTGQIMATDVNTKLKDGQAILKEDTLNDDGEQISVGKPGSGVVVHRISLPISDLILGPHNGFPAGAGADACLSPDVSLVHPMPSMRPWPGSFDSQSTYSSSGSSYPIYPRMSYTGSETSSSGGLRLELPQIAEFSSTDGAYFSLPPLTKGLTDGSLGLGPLSMRPYLDSAQFPSLPPRQAFPRYDDDDCPTD
ncbi:Nucleolar protein 4 [Grifola frondosa]|uniref:Nucleolar protein 4 n=1 Tax=Grifola frondosa TaxID=5627 RepID=A0A1C7MCF5_GRIFR|nr:Nucleolar protein 4 [Grifola frondosa]